MRHRLEWILGLAFVGALAASCGPTWVPLPAVPSDPALGPGPTSRGGGSTSAQEPGGAGLRAGVGRADITPPAGVPIGLYGPDGGVARGWRGRLEARAIALVDGRGETVVLCSVDLGIVPLGLHREVARRVHDRTGVGADRILLAATHTHAGPGNIFSWQSYNDHGSGRSGYDPDLLAFLADGIANAVVASLTSLRPARAGWVQRPVWGSTQNRSLDAYRANREDGAIDEAVRFEPPANLPAEQAAVDPTWTMLRVDTIGPSGRSAPAAAFSIFAVHGTANPAANDLIDSDLAGLVEHGLEERLGAGQTEVASVPLHAMVLGASGDVQLAGLETGVCVTPAARRPVRPAGPRTPPALDVWESPSEQPGSDCQAKRRAGVRAVAQRLSADVARIHAAAGSEMRGDLRVARAFRTLRLRGAGAPPGLCPGPELGTPTGGGSEDGESSLRDWKILGLFPTAASEGARDDRRTDCQAPKRRPPALLRAAVSPIVLPDVAELMVLRVGELLIGTLPAEPTTTTGLRVRTALLRAAGEAGLDVRGVALISLANGYMQYVATPEEYEAQSYEGSSTLYGAGSQPALAASLAELVATLPDGGAGETDSVSIAPGPVTRFLASPSVARPPGGFSSLACSRDTVVARWQDGGAGSVRPSDGPVIGIVRAGDGTYVRDGHPDVEVRHLGAVRGDRHLWEVRYAPSDRRVEGQEFRLRLLRWPDVPAGEVRCR